MEDNTSKVHAEPTGSRFNEALLRPDAGSAPGTALFVINLCTSIAPVTAAGKTIPGLESYRLYQVARSEDGRTRHRLRLGFFVSQEDADQALAMVRDSYPTAFTASLSDDDRRFARGFQPDTAASGKRPAPQMTLVEKMIASAAKEAPKQTSHTVSPPPAGPAVRVATQATTAPIPKAAPPENIAAASVPKAASAASVKAQTAKELATTATPAIAASTASSATTPVTAARPTSTPAVAKQTVIEQAIKAAPVIELTLASEPTTPPDKEPIAAASSEPFHVGKGIDIPAIALTLEATPAAPAATPAHEPIAASSIAKKSPVNAASQAMQKKPAMSRTPPLPAATPAHNAMRTVPPIPRSARDPNRPLPELDSTQTIRALTSAELNDDSQEKWFVIQLATSDQPVNLDAMPHLDIFEAYRLYSVANAGSGKIVHSLRIGFFREQVSAEAVAGYLKTFFASPSVLRISAAEQLRFNDAPLRMPAANGRSEAKVVDLSQARERAKPAIPTVTMEVPTPAQPVDPAATGSFNPTASGSFKTSSTGSNKALKQAAKSAVAARRSSARAAATGKYKALSKKSLNEQLLDEAREAVLSESAVRKLPKSDSLLSRLVGKLTK